MKLLKSVILACVVAPLVATQIGGGCVSTPPDPSTSGGGDASRDSDYSGVNAIPRDARLVDEGTGRIEFTPQRSDGRVYLYDADDRVLLDDRNIRRGQEYAALLDQNKAQLDGRTVLERDLKRKHVHRIYFLSDDYRGRGDRDQNWSGNKSPLPRGAQMVAESTGELTYRARENGRIYVVDSADQRVVHSQDVQKTQTLVVSPGKDRITINNKAVFTGNLVRDHVHRVYFEKDETRAGAKRLRRRGELATTHE